MTDERYNHAKEKARKKAKKVLKIIGLTIAGFALAILFGFVLMWLWNWLMPMIFNLQEITYWQAVGIFILAKLLFGGFGSSSNSSSDDSCSDKSRRKGFKHEFSKEFNKEFDKEFNKAYEKECDDTAEKDKDYDELYEKWWEEKGEQSFAEYMKSSEDKE